jgi:hypothetical protein
MLRHLAYEHLSTQDAQGQIVPPTEAKKLRSSQIQTDAYDIYKTDDWVEAIARLVTFVGTWKPVEPHAVRTFLKDIALTFSLCLFCLNPTGITAPAENPRRSQ